MKKLLKSKDNVVIVSHQGPDGDSLGSTLGFYHYLNKIGVNSIPIVPDDFPSFFDWMPGIDDIIIANQNASLIVQAIEKSDLIVCLDFNQISRVGKLLKNQILKSKAPVLVIDHHTNPQHFSEHEIIDYSVSSTCQLVYKFICDNQDKKLINLSIAECLYTGILTDTGSFRFLNVDSETHQIAAFFLKLGLNHSKIHNNIYDQNNLDKLHLLGHALKKINLLSSISVAYISLSRSDLNKFNYRKGDTEGLVNYCLSIKGVNMAVFLREDVEVVKISFRSKGDIKVNEFAEKYYGGGGHKNASGAAVSGDLNLITTQLIENLKKFMQ